MRRRRFLAADEGSPPTTRNPHTRLAETFAEASLHVHSLEWSNIRFVLRARQSHGSPPPGHPHTIPAALSHAGRRRPVDRSRRIPWRIPWRTHRRPATTPPSARPPEQIAYVNVLRDLLSWSSTLFVSREEADMAWQIFTPTLDQWTAGTVPLETYPAGTMPHTDD
ncbi:MAG: hypothetical protein ACR2M5_01095 [Nakamurella sp.]